MPGCTLHSRVLTNSHLFSTFSLRVNVGFLYWRRWTSFKLESCFIYLLCCPLTEIKDGEWASFWRCLPTEATANERSYRHQAQPGLLFGWLKGCCWCLLKQRDTGLLLMLSDVDACCFWSICKIQRDGWSAKCFSAWEALASELIHNTVTANLTAISGVFIRLWCPTKKSLFHPSCHLPFSTKTNYHI